MGIDTQLHVKSRNADTARVELLQRKLVLLEHSGKLVQLQHLSINTMQRHLCSSRNWIHNGCAQTAALSVMCCARATVVTCCARATVVTCTLDLMCSSAGAAGNEAQQVQDELQQIEDERAAQSDEYPVFQLIPKEMLIGKGKSLRLLPNDMGRWHTKVRTTCTSCTAALQP